MSIDLRLALNALSDVINNRPKPLREFDQIYMKAGDMVVHAEWMARKYQGKRLVFVGDGDAVGLALAHLMGEGVLPYGPAQILVLDFDERMANSIARFADRMGYGERIGSRLYNVLDALPDELVGQFDGFHINPPWGQYNDGESVVVFLERAIQCTRIGGTGVVVIADDASLPWTNQVLARTQREALRHGLIVQLMIPEQHAYHLEDAPDLRSCSLMFRKVERDDIANERIIGDRLEHFYGRNRTLRVHYVRERADPAPDRAPLGHYELDLLLPPSGEVDQSTGAEASDTPAPTLAAPRIVVA